ncbi:MFS transporter [Candidatus Pacearchaeota archaeon]|nr:MFS transporter [Candidatus Pacearchaeota archaeon]
MKQTTKFYLSSFLKNQTYFTPVIILFLQINNLSFQEIFWVFTIGTVVAFIAEIPTGIFADLFGKKKSVIISKIGIFLSFVVFGFSHSFWMFVLAQILFELGNSFRTGTETAYVYDYLDQTKETSYKIVKANQKVYARTGEAIATAIGSFIVVYINNLTNSNFGYNAVFFVAAIPAFFNFINAVSWTKIREKKHKINFNETVIHTKDSVKEVIFSKITLIIVINIMIFTSVLAALAKFIQPYMLEASVPVAYFGIIYTGALFLTAAAIKYYNKIEDKFDQRKTINLLTIAAVIPAIILGLGFISVIGVILFFLLVIVENIRSPIANDEFNKNVKSDTRATTGSILSLSKSLGKIAILPLAGWIADTWTMFTAILIMAIILLINGLLFYIGKNGRRNK